VIAIKKIISRKLSSQARKWARRRQGPDPSSVRLHSNRIYILPTRAGLIFAMIIFAMLMGAMNYNNNMGFALTFLLTGVGIISIYHCHRNLAGVHVHYLGGKPVFAGDEMRFRFALENQSPKSRWQMRVDWGGRHEVCDELNGDSRQTLTLRLATRRRGIIQGPKIKLSTRYPLGLVRAWAWIDMALTELVYADPAEYVDTILTGDSGRTISGIDAGGDDDFSGLRNYRLGDPPKHIAWKAMAKTGETLVKEYLGGTQDLIWIDWNACPEPDVERRISWLTRQVLDADSVNRSYGLRLPGIKIPPGQGAGHRHRCLQHLAMHGISADQWTASA
jgi:uncharacterized protein (DUF58 family)